jgi:hypothetical protein
MKGERRNVRGRCRRGTKNEVKILFPIMNEIAHLMIYAEMNEAFRHMLFQQGTSAQQIENDTPTSDLRMMDT